MSNEDESICKDITSFVTCVHRNILSPELEMDEAIKFEFGSF